MVNIYRMLFVASKKVHTVQITAHQVLTTQHLLPLPLDSTGRDPLPLNTIWKILIFGVAW